MRASRIEIVTMTIGIALAALLATSLFGQPVPAGDERLSPQSASAVAEAPQVPVKPAQVAAATGGTLHEVEEPDADLPVGSDPSGSVDEDLTDEEQMQARRETIREYFAERRAKLNIVATTRTSSGQEFDWIPSEALDEDGSPMTPPPPIGLETGADVEAEHREQGDQMALTELEQEPDAWGPEGTVPVVRMDTDEYIASIQTRGTLQDFLSKYGDQDVRRFPEPRAPEAGAPAPASPEPGLFHPERGYAFSWHEEQNLGSKGAINIWQPYVGDSAEFSLGQTSVSATTDASRICFSIFCFGVSSVLQTIEAGWQKAPPGTNINGDWFTHFFIYFNTNGYASQGDNVGGYNHTVDGFVQYSSTVTPGARITSISRLGGAQYSASIDVRLWQGNWWIRYGNQWVGYYPASLFGGLRTGGLENRSEKVTWYGEVVDLPDGVPTTTDMGSGRFPGEGFGYSAYQRNLLVRRTDGVLVRFDPDARGGTGADVGCYDLEPHFGNTGSWQSYFYWGGPGRNNSTCP
jgi:hypothetical protein